MDERIGGRPQAAGPRISREDRPPLLRAGETAWRIEPAGRVAFIVDAADYFVAFARAIAKAQKSVLVLGWDVHSKTSLFREQPPGPWPDTLGEFLSAIAAARRGLHVHVLDWDYHSLYSLERELLPVLKMGWRTHRRVHFALDAEHPSGASHHQKVVVVDDQVAFVGGLDLTVRRWDTPEHLAFDPRRVDHDGKRYPPFHDVMIAVDGAAAAALGDLARDRWRRATGAELKAPETGADPWPEELRPDLEDVRVAISRTDPEHGGRAAVREVERLFLESIAAARSCIFFENQYLTSNEIGEALAARLREPDGPEVVVVVPRECTGWLEKETMGVLRDLLLAKLFEADLHGRFRPYSPAICDLLPGECLGLHSKVMIIDERLVRVGSANLSNRSMWLDTECDLAIESGGDRRVERAITAFRDRLLAEHLAVEPATVAREVASRGSLLAAIEALRGEGRSLAPVARCDRGQLTVLHPGLDLADPEKPIGRDAMLIEIPPEDARADRGPLIALCVVLLLIVGLALAWRFTPLGEWLDLRAVSLWAEPVRDEPLGALLGIGGFVAGTLVMIPVTLMFVELAFLFGSVLGFAYGMAGALLAAGATYGLGRVLGKRTVRRLAGFRVGAVAERMSHSGVFAVAAVRALPVAPFNVVNLVAGATSVRPRSFFLGTALGLLPGALSMTILGGQLLNVVADRGPGAIVLLVCLCVGILLAAAWLRRRFVVKHISASGAAPRGTASA